MSEVIGPVKHATASRLGKAWIAIPLVQALAGWDGRSVSLTPDEYAWRLTRARERQAA
jgi:hypothetical protein